MGQIIELREELKLNPYVNQMERFSKSFKYLAEVFQNKKNIVGEYSKEDIYEIAVGAEVRVCDTCENRLNCQHKIDNTVKQLVELLIHTINEYGEELSIEKKRDMQKQCENFNEMKKQVSDAFAELKKRKMWEERLHLNKDASIVMMRVFAEAIEESTKELDASIVEDERLEKKIANNMRKLGVRPLKITLFLSATGQYEVHVSAKAKTGACIAINEMATIISEAMGRRFVPEITERFVMKESYGTNVFIERAKYQIMYGIAKRKMDKSTMSGDNFLVMDMPGGKKAILLSDGMGSGKRAYQESSLILELAESFLVSGLSPQHCMEIMNASLVTEKEEVQFATLDMCIIDMYGGGVDFFKAGASSTYMKNKKGLQCYRASSLPLGVITDIEINHYQNKLEEDNYIIMMTDGVFDLIPEENKKKYINDWIRNAKTKNPNELANLLLEQVLEENHGKAQDDLMILIVGAWQC